MPGTPLTGNAASFNTAVTVTTTGPAAGEAPAAAHVNVPAQKAVDGLEHYRTYGARNNIANTFAQAQTFDAGITLHASSDAAAQIVGDVVPTTKALVMAWKVDASIYARIYVDTNKAIWQTLNARWNAAGPEWVPDSAGSDSSATFTAGAGGSPQFATLFKAAGGGPFASFDYVMKATDGTGIEATDRVIGGTGVRATTGDVDALAGDLYAPAGSVIVAGDPASDEARVYCKQVISQAAAAPTGSKGAAMNNGAGDGSVTITGTDIAGAITVVTGAAVNAASGQLVTTVTLNKSYPANPIVHLYPSNINAADLATQPACASTAGNTFTVTIGASALTAGGTAYGWTYQIVG